MLDAHVLFCEAQKERVLTEKMKPRTKLEKAWLEFCQAVEDAACKYLAQADRSAPYQKPNSKREKEWKAAREDSTLDEWEPKKGDYVFVNAEGLRGRVIQVYDEGFFRWRVQIDMRVIEVNKRDLQPDYPEE